MKNARGENEDIKTPEKYEREKVERDKEKNYRARRRMTVMRDIVPGQSISRSSRSLKYSIILLIVNQIPAMHPILPPPPALSCSQLTTHL